MTYNMDITIHHAAIRSSSGGRAYAWGGKWYLLYEWEELEYGTHDWILNDIVLTKGFDPDKWLGEDTKKVFHR